MSKKETKKTNANSTEKKPALKWIIIAAVAVVAVIAAIIIVFATRSIADKTNNEVVESDIETYAALVNKMNGGEASLERRTYGDVSEALAAFVNEYNAVNGDERVYVLTYNEGNSIARGKTDPWGNKYYITAKKTSSNSDISSYTYYIISAGKDGKFNTSTLVLDNDDIYDTLLKGVAVNIVQSNEDEDDDDTNFGIDDIIAEKEPEPEPSDSQPVSDDENLPTRITITFNNQGGSGGPSSERIKNGTAMSSLSFTIPTKENYTFKGYFTEGDGNGDCYFDENGVGIGTAAFKNDITLFAYWQGNSTTLMFDNDGGSGYASINATYGSRLPNVSVPTKSGYSFLGYYSKPNGEGERYYNSNGAASTVCEFESTTTLYAYWSAQTYTVEHYVMNTDGTYPASPEYSEQKANRSNNEINLAGLVDSTLIVDNGIVYDHATVDGVQATVAVIEDNNTVVRLYYKRCQYSVTLSTQSKNAELSGAGKYYYGAKVLINATVADGYAWSGWLDLATDKYVSKDARYTFTMPAYAVSYEGRTGSDTYTIYLDANGGTCRKLAVDVLYGESYYDKLPTASRTGYTFAGWATTTDAKSVVARSVKYTDKSDITLYAIWTANQYTITLNTQGGQGGTKTVSATYGKNLPAIQYLPTRAGYNFMGYFTSAYWSGEQYYNEDGNGITDYILTSDITLYARWEGKQYNIRYYDQGGKEFSGTHGYDAPTSAVYGTACKLVSPSKPGYIFGGWYNTSGCTGTSLTYATLADPDSNTLDLYALWLPETYDIVYRDQGDMTFTGTHGANAPSTVTYGTPETLVSPSREGYNFLGWYSDKECTKAITKVSYTAGGVTVYAKWEANTYTIAYFDKDGAAFSGEHGTNAPMSVTYGTTVDLVIPTRNGYDFVGWYTDAACTTAATSVTGAGADATINLYALWKAQSDPESYDDHVIQIP